MSSYVQYITDFSPFSPIILMSRNMYQKLALNLFPLQACLGVGLQHPKLAENLYYEMRNKVRCYLLCSVTTSGQYYVNRVTLAYVVFPFCVILLMLTFHSLRAFSSMLLLCLPFITKTLLLSN